MAGKTIGELKIGDKDGFSKTISESDIYLYAGVTGDLNPAHINEEQAKDSIFGGRVAHGMLSAGLISAVLGMRIPGPGTVYLGQELRFKAPVRIGDTVTAEAEVIEIFTEKNIVKLKTICKNQKETIVIEGVATVMPPK